jgi:hypothetical protein
VGIYINGKCVQIIPSDRKNSVKVFDRRVDLSHRPDIKVGHVWGTEPEGYGTTYHIVDDQVVPITPESAEPAPAPAVPAQPATKVS